MHIFLNILIIYSKKCKEATEISLKEVIKLIEINKQF